MERKTIAIIASIAVVVVALVTTLLLVQPWGGDETEPVAVPEGYSTEVTVPTVDPNQPQLAAPKPTEAPPMIYAEGDCKVALDSLRALFAKYPSGLALDEAGNAELNSALPSLSTACDADTASKFQAQELSPWLNYSVN